VEFGEVVELAGCDDDTVSRELDHLCEHLAMAMAQVVNLFDPQGIFVNGRLFDELPWLREQLVERVRRLALQPAIDDCRLFATSSSHLSGAVATAISAVTSARVRELQDTLTGITFNVTRQSAN